MNRAIVTLAALLSASLVSVPASAVQAAGADPAERLPLATIVTAPDQYAGKAVVIRGVVAAVTRAVFPNGRPYYTLSVGDGQTAVTVFSWERPPVEQGDRVEVEGVFYPWRYNLRQVIDSRRITRSRSSTQRLRTRRASVRAQRTCVESA
ncbi:MAG: hypothetical protein HYY64_11495 [Candidatus Rokubacteria bacterium]|nr:hypothetical protein [Candidatus Rokubacteria bacterium]